MKKNRPVPARHTWETREHVYVSALAWVASKDHTHNKKKTPWRSTDMTVIY